MAVLLAHLLGWRPGRCSEVVLRHSPDEPGEMLPQLDGLFLLDKAVQGVLHHILIFHMHLNLVLNPVTIRQTQQVLGQTVIIRVDWLVIDDSLLLDCMP